MLSPAVERLKKLQRRIPAKQRLFPVLLLLIRAGMMIQLLVGGVEQAQILTTLARTDYYYKDGEPPQPFTFDELVCIHHSSFKHWFRVDTPR